MTDTKKPADRDLQIVARVQSIYASKELGKIRDAHEGKKSLTVQIGAFSVQYEPLPFSGMTAFPAGFVIGREAFASEDELKKTLLHEVYRLSSSAIGRGGGADPETIRAETNAAFHFAEQFHRLV